MFQSRDVLGIDDELGGRNLVPGASDGDRVGSVGSAVNGQRRERSETRCRLRTARSSCHAASSQLSDDFLLGDPFVLITLIARIVAAVDLKPTVGRMDPVLEADAERSED